MIKKLFFSLFIVFSLGCFGQNTMEDYELLVKPFLKIEGYNSCYQLEWSEDRLYSKDTLNRSGLESEIHKKLSTQNYKLFDREQNVLLKNINPITIKITTRYFSLIENQSKETSAMAIFDLVISGGDFFKGDFEYNVREEIFMDEKLKKIRKGKYEEKVNHVRLELIERVAQNFSKKIIERTGKNHQEKLFFVSEFGCSTHETDALALAEQAALVKAGEKAFGIQLNATTTVVDIYDVSDHVETKMNGQILSKFVDKTYTKKLMDGNQCVLINAIFKK